MLAILVGGHLSASTVHKRCKQPGRVALTFDDSFVADTSVIWSPIPWRFPGDRIVVFLSSTCTSCEAQQRPVASTKSWHRSSVMVYLNDQLTQAIAQARGRVPTVCVTLGRTRLGGSRSTQRTAG